jgi:hypothetical protein
MAFCSKCGKPLVCSCGAPAELGSPVKDCPPKKGAIWIHVQDDQGVDITGATGKRGGETKDSNNVGLATFDPLDPGKYDVDLGPLSTELKKLYDPPELSTQRHVTVEDGTISYVPYTLPRKARLKVKVVTKDGSKVLEGATVTITGTKDLGQKPTLDKGIADFELVPKGKYAIKAKLKDADDKDYATTLDFTKVTQEVELFPGQEKEVQVEVEPKNIVTPKLDLEYKLVLLDTKLYDKQAVFETKILPSPTYVQISFDQSNKDHPFAKGAALVCTPANVEVFLDEFCKKKLTGAITNKQLTDSPPLKLYLRGTAAGVFKVTLKLEDPADRFIRLEKNLTDAQDMGVIKVELKLHQQDLAQLQAVGMRVDPDTEPIDTYYTNLKNTALPAQKLMTDDEKIGEGSKDDATSPGRLLHVQHDNHFGRGKLICAQLEATHLPAGTDDYEIVLNVGRGWAPDTGAGALKPEDMMGGGKDTATGGIELYDAEDHGARLNIPVKTKISDLKAGAKTFYVQGIAETDQACDLRLDMGMDRAAGGLAKTVKRNGDWVRFTIVEIKEVKVAYAAPVGGPNAWDAATQHYFINFKADPDGRKVEIQAELTRKLKNVVVHFMLAPDKDNRKKANWGIDMPGNWVWKDITKDLKHLDKNDRRDFLHLSEKTDPNGLAKKELTLSRFGGDKFQPGCYLEQDAHLAKYVPGHPDLGNRKPVLCADTIIVWRKFWYQLVTVQGVANPGVAGAEARYELVTATMANVAPPPPAPPPAATFTQAQATGWNAVYPRYMIELHGDANTNALVISNQNKANFFPNVAADPAHPVKVRILICDAQWDSSPDTAAVSTDYYPFAEWPDDITTDRLVLTPPLQGGNLLVAGTLEYRYRELLVLWVTGSLALPPASVDVNPDRNDLCKVRVKMPQSAIDLHNQHPTLQVRVVGLQVKGANGPYLGEYTHEKVLAVFDPSEELDFQNSVAHEIGHGFWQTIEHADVPAGIPNHPNQYISHDQDGHPTGSHCKTLKDKCVMYESGPIARSYDRYCDVCLPYLLVDDMSRFK